jgi:4-diphosphocytidyl-2-C-methyl-D-erythritol kinase
MTKVEVFAPAKINLTLHVTGQRSDGYHDLDSLVAFAELGDALTLEPAHRDRLVISGPEASDIPASADNSVAKVASALWDSPLSIEIRKEIPVASGLGGGSADAAACYRALKYLSTFKSQSSQLYARDAGSLRCLSEFGSDNMM